MRTIINRNTLNTILANRRDRIVVAAADVVRNVAVALPISGQFSQVQAGFTQALKRALKPAAARAAQAVESIGYLIGSCMPGSPRCWHMTHCVVPHHAVVSLSS